ncbi:hypothetical protein V8C37DRAFT_364023 [Trichoderma ceciliae]
MIPPCPESQNPPAQALSSVCPVVCLFTPHSRSLSPKTNPRTYWVLSAQTITIHQPPQHRFPKTRWLQANLFPETFCISLSLSVPSLVLPSPGFAHVRVPIIHARNKLKSLTVHPRNAESSEMHDYRKYGVQVRVSKKGIGCYQILQEKTSNLHTRQHKSLFDLVLHPPIVPLTNFLPPTIRKWPLLYSILHCPQHSRGLGRDIQRAISVCKPSSVPHKPNLLSTI